MSDEQEGLDGAERGEKKAMVYCGWCGAHSEGAPLTWSMVTMGARGAQLLCDSCTRTNLRSIESQLSTDWW